MHWYIQRMRLHGGSSHVQPTEVQHSDAGQPTNLSTVRAREKLLTEPCPSGSPGLQLGSAHYSHSGRRVAQPAIHSNNNNSHGVLHKALCHLEQFLRTQEMLYY